MNNALTFAILTYLFLQHRPNPPVHPLPSP
jgi:hypothetical protein